MLELADLQQERGMEKGGLFVKAEPMPISLNSTGVTITNVTNNFKKINVTITGVTNTKVYITNATNNFTNTNATITKVFTKTNITTTKVTITGIVL